MKKIPLKNEVREDRQDSPKLDDEGQAIQDLPFFVDCEDGETVKTETMPLSEIIQDDKTFRCRKKDDDETIERYADVFTAYKEAVEQGKNPDYPFPAVWVWKDQEVDKYTLVCGYHRYAAALKAGIDTILVKVFEGTKDAAVWVALRDNRKHGLRLKSGDLKDCIKKAIALFPDKSPGVIAKELGCSRAYASRIDKEVSTSRQVNTGEKRHGTDGKKYPAQKRNPPKEQPSAESQNTPEQPSDKEEKREPQRILPQKNTDTTPPADATQPPTKEESNKWTRAESSAQATIQTLQSMGEGYIQKEERIHFYKTIRTWLDTQIGTI